ncbi:TonB-dependent receptor, partial [uncultured Chryseobacterium sp.]|uniref:TonB-dependent receptor n=1 Tax=uncultured Chryseobacterium sp. TaxID=259322 RepID=UPI002630C0FF
MQNFSLSGSINSEKVNQLEINLFNSEDQLVKTEVADQKGNFSFEDLSTGNYYVKINKNGSETYKSENISVTGNTTLPAIQLNEKLIEGVTLTKAKPYIERKEGKMILNVENSIASTGNSAFEVLEKAPGVNVDSNDNISLRGKGNILVQIDGKNTPMTGTDLANYLRGIPSSSLDKIEFITNPSSKYDAAGTSIINVKLKKDQRKGTNGSASIALGTGRYVKNNNNFSINHRNKKVNVFANYSFAYREFFNHLVLDRNFFNDGVFEKAYQQDNFLKMDFRNHIAKAGMDYYMNDKNILGFSVGFISNRFNPTGDNSSVVLGSDHLPDYTFTTQNRSMDHWKNASFNLNHKYTLDSLNSNITTDFDYINYSNTSLQNFDTRNYTMSGGLMGNPYLLKGDVAGNLNIYSLKSDLT